MKLNQLGRSDIRVSEICLGSMTWGSQNSEQEAHQQLDYAFARGVNFVDSAEMYPTTPRKKETTGLTESLIGTWLQNQPNRDNIIIATKVTGEGNKDVRDGRRVDGTVIREAIEGSLKRLRTDYIDLYQLHWPNRGSYHFRQNWTYNPLNQNIGNIDQEIADMLGEIAALIQEGKLRTFGLSNESAWGTMKFLEIADKHNLPRIVSIQNEYNLTSRLFDLDLAEVSIREQIGLMCFSPLAAGGLSGKYLDGKVPAGSRLSMQPKLNGRYTDKSIAVIRRYVQIAEKHGIDPAQLAIAFCISRPFMMSTIIGATSMEQLTNNLNAAEKKLDDDILEEIQSVYRDDPMPV